MLHFKACLVSALIWFSGSLSAQAVLAASASKSLSGFQAETDSSKLSSESGGFLRHPTLYYNFLSPIRGDLGFIFESGSVFGNFRFSLPFAFGVVAPPSSSTQPTIHNRYSSSYFIDLGRKKFEIGFGATYFPKIGSEASSPYFGVNFMLMQFWCDETFYGEIDSALNRQKFVQTNTMNRLTFSICTGTEINYGKHVRFNIQGNLGLLFDSIRERIQNPATNKEVPNFANPSYLWARLVFGLGYVF